MRLLRGVLPAFAIVLLDATLFSHVAKSMCPHDAKLLARSFACAAIGVPHIRAMQCLMEDTYLQIEQAAVARLGTIAFLSNLVEKQGPLALYRYGFKLMLSNDTETLTGATCCRHCMKY